MLYFKEDESRNHLFCSCDFNRSLWAKVIKWLGANTNLSADDFSLFSCKHIKVKEKEVRRILSVLWFTLVGDLMDHLIDA